MIRSASHAGSWYSSDGRNLSAELDEWMDAADAELPLDGSKDVRAIIAPHAGYRFSGKTAGYSYAGLRRVAESIKTIYVLGPSHHVYSKSCMLTLADWLDTPCGRIKVDKIEIARLAKLKNFTMWRSLEEDEDEHSVEMQLPYIARAMKANTDYSVVSITVGNLTHAQEAEVGTLLAGLLHDPKVAVVISSDFCHWGSRFNYQYRLIPSLPIHASIEQLDRQGISLIENKDHKAFSEYLKQYKNTICGRHPIGILLGMIEASTATPLAMEVKFVHYEQSSACTSMSDSSVSYAAALVLA